MKEKHVEEELTGNYTESIDNLLTLFIGDENDRTWALEEITQAGPPHKRFLSALLLSKAYNLIKKTEARTGKTFTPLTGAKVVNKKYEEEYIMPADLLIEDIDDNGNSEAELVAKAPDHESLAYLFAMQAIDWATQQE